MGLGRLTLEFTGFPPEFQNSETQKWRIPISLHWNFAKLAGGEEGVGNFPSSDFHREIFPKKSNFENLSRQGQDGSGAVDFGIHRISARIPDFRNSKMGITYFPTLEFCETCWRGRGGRELPLQRFPPRDFS